MDKKPRSIQLFSAADVTRSGTPRQEGISIRRVAVPVGTFLQGLSKPQRPNPAVSDQSLMPSARIDSIAFPVRVIVRLLPLSLTLGRIVRYTLAIGASRLTWKSPRAALFSLCSIYFDFITAFDSCGIRGQNFSASSCRPHGCGWLPQLLVRPSCNLWSSRARLTSTGSLKFFCSTWFETGK